ncbi:AaceriAFL215Cp [[Ashbya] aceris (nom. inval.)]|nr:AaceriAFL215Cp [[Ashbya] aceris (nom. inval.)]
MIFRDSGNIPLEPNEAHDQEQHDIETYLTVLQPHTILLKDGETTATMYPIRANSDLLPLGLLAFLLDEFNMEVEKGDSFPYYEPLDLDEFRKMWFHTHGIVCVMVLGEIPELDYSLELSEEQQQQQTEQLRQQGVTTERNTIQYQKRKERRNMNLNIQWEKQCLGTFNLLPAYPGRSSHVVTGTFLVNAGIRGKGIGRTLVERFLEWAPQLGFTSCCFPLVYGTNVGIRRILESSNFKRIGKLPESGILKGYDSPIDSFIYGKEFTHVSKQIDALNSARNDSTKAKYERLKFYLETSEYPASCSRNEKARLRVMSKTHSILNGKLMFKGREVVYEPRRQLEIAYETHAVDHQGINRVTSKVAERFHWKGIKQSVAKVISTCPRCQDNAAHDAQHPGSGIVIDATGPANQTHVVVHAHANDDHLSRVAEAVVGSLQRAADYTDSPPAESTPRARPYPPPGQLRRIRFHPQPAPKDSDSSMNSFTRYAEEHLPRAAKKRSRYDPAPAHPDSPKSASESATVLLDDTPAIDDALLHLEDNVIAAVEAVRKEQRAASLHRSPNTDDDYVSDDPSFHDDRGYY